MGDGSSSPTHSLPLDVARQIDPVCDRFETAWREGRQPRIEDFLSDTPEPVRTALLRELLALELAYRRQQAEAPTPEEYEQRFPAHRQLLRDFFRASTPVIGAGDDPAAAPGGGEPQTSDVPQGGPHTRDFPEDDGSSSAATLPGRGPPAGEVAAGMRLGDYDLLEKLGAGGMGLVFRARQRQANRIVALKVIRPEVVEGLPAERYRQWLARFRQEAQFAARLDHPGIITVYDVGEWDGRAFFSMRYVAGQSLAEMVRAGPLPDRRAATYMERVARAVAHAHGRGILHRDLKPGNILVGADDQPFVTDFGLAKGLEGSVSLTDTGACLGSPPFMSPEQVHDSSRVTEATDVYSLGATLYALLTGRPPFQAARAAETLNQVLNQEPVPPRQLNPAIPRDLETITLKCLRKETWRRYGSADDFADDLSSFIKGEPIRARPVGRGERLLRWTRRNPLAAGLAAGLVILFLAFWAATLIGYQRVRMARAEVNQERAEVLREAQRAAFVEQATAHALTAESGRRWTALAALRRAVAIRPGEELRDAYLRYLDLPDLRLVEERELPPQPGSDRLPPIAAARFPRPALFGEIAYGASPGGVRLLTPAGPVESGCGGHVAGAGLAGVEGLRAPAVLSPNGRFVAAVLPEGGGAQVWDLNTGKVLGMLRDEAGRTPVPHLIAFNGSSDGLAVAFRLEGAAAFAIRTFRLSPQAVEPLKTWKLGATGLDCLAISPAGDLAAAGLTVPRGPGADCYGIWRWQRAAAPPPEPLRLDGAGGWNHRWRAPRRIAFSADGRFLVAARDYLRLWDLAGPAPRELWAQPLTPHRAAGVLQTGDGHWVITRDFSGRLTLWDAFAEGRLVLRAGPSPTPANPAIDWTGRDATSLLVDERPDDGRPPGVRVWQIAQPLSRVIAPPQSLGGSPAGPEHLALAFSPDERWLAYAYAPHLDGAPYLVDLQHPEARPRSLKGGPAYPRRLAFSPTGDQLWSVSDQGQVTWRLPDFQAIPEVRKEVVAAAAFGGQGRVVGCLHEKVQLTVIDPASGRELWAGPAEDGSAEFVSPPQFSPDGRQLLAATRTAADAPPVRFQLWDCERHARATATLPKTGRFFFQGTTPTALTDDRTLGLRDLKQGRNLQVFPRDLPPLLQNSWTFDRFSFSGDGRLVGEKLASGAIAVWEFNGPERKLRAQVSRAASSYSMKDLVAFNRDGSRLAAFDTANFLKAWDTKTGRELGRLPLTARPELFGFAGADDTVLLVYLGSRVLSWRPGDKEARRLCSLESNPALDREKGQGWWQRDLLLIADAIRLSADGRRLIYVARPDERQAYTIYVWSLPDGKLTTRSVPARGRGWPRLGLSADGSKLALLEAWADVLAGGVCLDQLDWSRIKLRETLRSRLMQVLRLSPDGGYGAYVQNRPTGPLVRVVRLADQATVFAQSLSQPVTGVALAAEGRALALGHPGGRITLYRPRSGKDAVNLDGGTGPVESLTFDRSATLLATATSEGTVALWNAQTGERLVRLTTDWEGVNRVALSPGGRWLAVLNGSGSLRLWDLNTVHARLKEAGLDWE